MLAFILGVGQLQFIHMAINRADISSRLYVNYNDGPTELDIKHSGKEASTLKHQERVVICNVKLINVMFGSITE